MAEQRVSRTKIVSVTRKKDQKIIDDARRPLKKIFWAIIILVDLFLLVGIKMRFF